LLESAIFLLDEDLVELRRLAIELQLVLAYVAEEPAPKPAEEPEPTEKPKLHIVPDATEAPVARKRPNHGRGLRMPCSA